MTMVSVENLLIQYQSGRDANGKSLSESELNWLAHVLAYSQDGRGQSGTKLIPSEFVTTTPTSTPSMP